MSTKDSLLCVNSTDERQCCDIGHERCCRCGRCEYYVRRCGLIISGIGVLTFSWETKAVHAKSFFFSGTLSIMEHCWWYLNAEYIANTRRGRRVLRTLPLCLSVTPAQNSCILEGLVRCSLGTSQLVLGRVIWTTFIGDGPHNHEHGRCTWWSHR